jgi:NCAIR mutase (PurE)-related protein
MDIESLLQAVAAGETSVATARERIEGYTRVDEFARLDVARDDRNGVPEVVLGEGKSPEQVASIVSGFLGERERVIVSRVDDDHLAALEPLDGELEVHGEAGLVVAGREGSSPPEPAGRVAVVTGGTADVPVAEEAAVVAREMGRSVSTHYDVGVAGLHRILGEVPALDEADCVVVAAGREGALPTVVAGLVDAPVIGLPVSVGYGHGGDGEAALSSMLQSCAVLSVVNIDAGVVAGAQAAQVARPG